VLGVVNMIILAENLPVEPVGLIPAEGTRSAYRR
jgi:hypothetical protein